MCKQFKTPGKYFFPGWDSNPQSRQSAFSDEHVTLQPPYLRGSLKSDLEKLQRAVEQQHKTVFSSECEPFVLTSSDNYQESPPSNGVHRVLVLGPSDGRETLTGVARELSEQVHQHHLAATDVDINLLNNRLTGTNGGFPEPSLAVVVGSPPSLLGYLPWHTRLTEILFISSHRKITYQQFHSLLQRYAGTTQRFGR
jgi:dehydrodolichyl diphosphate syntase complex subunit NUS1